MTDIRISDADAGGIAASHGEAAETIEGTAASAPASVDAGPATAAINAILARVAQEAGDLALVNRGAEEVMRQTADSYSATEESVAGQFADLTSGVPERWTR